MLFTRLILRIVLLSSICISSTVFGLPLVEVNSNSRPGHAVPKCQNFNYILLPNTLSSTIFLGSDSFVFLHVCCQRRNARQRGQLGRSNAVWD
ncbi:hypothetical protein EV361DRAFT_535354 [Lentinula raphanica]|nr:hypothetical protein EV361DRAFT_535354 [Lentinula raphanica]